MKNMSGQNKIKQYVRASERLEYGYGAKGQNSERSLVRPLGFDTCALSLQRFVDPVLTPGGNVYDIVALVPWIAKHHTDPVSGEVRWFLFDLLLFSCSHDVHENHKCRLCL